MKTIYKLVLKSYLGPMVLTFFIIMFVLMMNVLWRYIDELVGKGLDPGTIIELLCYATINMIPMALPLATLLAAIMTMGNLGENYELLAMKSAGMSLPKIMRPLLVVVSILAVGSFFIANNLVPYANKKFFRTIYDIRQMNQTLEFQVGKGLDPGTIIELLCYATINMIPMALPLATLLAAIMTMGNLGENYELLAMKSAGMSLPKIMRPLLVVVSILAVGSFFIANNLVPYANKKFFRTIYDIRQMNQTLEFQDGLFFNGIDGMSIRVGHQNQETGLLTDVLIYDNRNASGNMTTTVADSGYIRLSDDKRFLEITLFNGERYEQTRNSSQWYNKSSLQRNKFELQKANISISGFEMQRTDADLFNNAQTKNISELQYEIDTLTQQVNSATTRSYDPLLKERIFVRDTTVITDRNDSVVVEKRDFRPMDALDSLATLDLRSKDRIWSQAVSAARNSRSMFSFDESQAKNALNQLYRSKVEWHKKLALPVTIIIFFLIGAPLGAIVRRGGLGMPIVISVIFFVIYYIISSSGEKMAKEGTWEAFYGTWLSAFVLAPVAIYLTYKATNDSGLLDVDWYVVKFKKIKEKISGIFARFAHKNKK